ncbi:pentapeptide repeat-containing protein [uncultured Shewanella sp.]|uniref:pentapeptide repeat-containing protein n=1 Tax=uncultured Shewanella sp. TaxID=173975 RepID=UPI0026052938|nr:pentapeptide repeat-containing protein [uncultured Shewanella sp.]
MCGSSNIKGKWVNHGEYYEEVFEGVIISQQHFSGIQFEGCTFNDCDFNEAAFKNCKFIHCQFNRCNMSVVRWLYTELFDMNFIECKLIGVDWTQADWPTFRRDPELTFKHSMLNGASFFGLVLQGVVFDSCQLRDVDFREGDFSNAKITHCDLFQSLFMGTQLRSVDFTDSVHFDINILNNTLTHAKFSRFEALNLLQSLGIILVD